MEETYWKQFMTTGKVEDYLQFKQVSGIEGKTQQFKEKRISDRVVDTNKQNREKETLR